MPAKLHWPYFVIICLCQRNKYVSLAPPQDKKVIKSFNLKTFSSVKEFGATFFPILAWFILSHWSVPVGARGAWAPREICEHPSKVAQFIIHKDHLSLHLTASVRRRFFWLHSCRFLKCFLRVFCCACVIFFVVFFVTWFGFFLLSDFLLILVSFSLLFSDFFQEGF